jgi:TolA-binding protein
MFKKIIPVLIFLLIFSSGLAGQAQATEKEDDLFFVAQKAFEDGFYDVALRYLDQFLKEFPQTTKRQQVSLLIGQCYFFDNQYLKAFDQFEGLLKSPEMGEIRDAVCFWMGEVYLKSKDYKQAESFYKRLINEFPASAYLPQGYYSLGWTYSEQGLYEDAIAAFSEIIKRYPANNLVEDVHFKIGESLLNLKQYPEAIDKLNAYIKKYPQSNRLDQVYFYIAEANYYLEDFEPAIKNYSQVIGVTKDERLANLARISSGWAYLRMKKYPESQNLFEQAEAAAIVKNLELDEILLGKASLFAQMEDYSKGLVAYEDIIAKLPNSRWLIDAKLGRGNCLHELGRYQEAVAAFQDILDRFSGKKEFSEQIEKAYFGLGWSNLKLGKPKEAIDNFRKVMEISPDKAVRLSALCQIGDIYQDMGELQSAVDTYDKILKDYPDSPYTDYLQYREGIALLKMDRVEAATLIFQGLSKNFPKSRFVTDAQYYLGMAYFKKGDFVASKEQFEDLLERLPRDSEYRPELMYSLGLNLAYLKEYKKAVDVFERLKKDYPQNDELMQKADLEIGNDLSQWGKEQDAVKKFKLILYKYPKSMVGLKANLWLGEYYLKAGKFDMARKYLNDCLKDYPDSDKTDQARYLLGLTFKNERRYDEALNEFKAILAKQKSNTAVDASLAVADILSETAKPEEAASIYQEIVAQHPEAARDAYVKLGDLYRKGSYFDKSIEAYQKAFNLASDSSQIENSQIQFKLAEAIEGGKDFNRAIETYLKIPYLYPRDTRWVVKSYLRVARIFEDKENWEEAKKIYEKISQENVEEAKFAVERLEWIKENIKP